MPRPRAGPTRPTPSRTTRRIPTGRTTATSRSSWATPQRPGQKNAGDFVTLNQPANGITSAKRTTISQNATGAPGSSAAGNGCGRVSAYGDFNHDGLDDLAIGAGREKIGTDLDGGTVEILQGSACGLPGGANTAGSSHGRWGAVPAATDINDDGYPMFGANAAN
ncbi:FG-GAP repeat protein [Streptomyces sp. NPDC059900]|uniref:integrin alpha n=1 Tax=Streptomyces sp. NPDC059900 TaxID=3155816 RepID=UPI0034333662